MLCACGNSLYCMWYTVNFDLYCADQAAIYSRSDYVWMHLPLHHCYSVQNLISILEEEGLPVTKLSSENNLPMF